MPYEHPDKCRLGVSHGAGRAVLILGGPAAVAGREKEPGGQAGPDHHGFLGSSRELQHQVGNSSVPAGAERPCGKQRGTLEGLQGTCTGRPVGSKRCLNHTGTFLCMENIPCCFHPRMPQHNSTQTWLAQARDQAQHRSTWHLAAAANSWTRTFLLLSCRKNYLKSALPHLSTVCGASWRPWKRG